MRRFAQIAPFIAAALVAGCGSSSSSSSSSSSPAGAASSSTSSSSTHAAAGAASRQLTLSETEFKILPASPVVAHPGTITVTVKNAGRITHALDVQTPSGLARTADIAPGHTAKLTVALTKDGRYTFYCPIDGHRMLGMQGTLTVGGSAATGGAPVSPSAKKSSSSSSSSGVAGY